MSKNSSLVRAKMVCGSVDRTGTGENEQYSIRLSPVTSGSKENESFYKYTPGGTIIMEVVSPETAGYFQVGKEYYVDFTEAKGE
jgi:hypothetical protein